MAVDYLWHRTLVYFGMADEADDYDDELDDDRYDEAQERRSSASAHEDLERNYRERPNVRRLGPRRRDPDFDDIFAEEAPCNRPTPMRSVESRPQSAEVHLIVPKSFNDAQQIADKFKGRSRSSSTSRAPRPTCAKRLIDFSSGLTYALDGGMQRVADKVFLLTPRNVEVSAEERARPPGEGLLQPVLMAEPPAVWPGRVSVVGVGAMGRALAAGAGARPRRPGGAARPRRRRPSGGRGGAGGFGGARVGRGGRRRRPGVPRGQAGGRRGRARRDHARDGAGRRAPLGRGGLGAGPPGGRRPRAALARTMRIWPSATGRSSPWRPGASIRAERPS